MNDAGLPFASTKAVVLLNTWPVGDEIEVPAGAAIVTTSGMIVARTVIQSRQAGAIVRNPKWPGRAFRNAPRIHQMGIGNVCHAGLVGNQIVLHIGIGRGRGVRGANQSWKSRQNKNRGSCSIHKSPLSASQ